MMKQMPHVLLSNDDGVFFPGIRTLADAFLGAGWRVSVCAPDNERSAASHSIVMREPIVVRRVEWETEYGRDRLNVWKTSGTPADCVRIALFELLREDLPDIVVSGINNGWNAGTDCHYSGTVGAAMEAYFQDLPAIAVSTRRSSPSRNRLAAQYALRTAERVLAHGNPREALWNLNLPDCEEDEVQGFVEATMAHAPYTDTYDKLERSENHGAYWLRGELVPEKFAEGSDLYWLWRNYATITAFDWNWTKPNRCGFILQD